jgi:putative FmdB family regulatory protein
MLFTPQVIYESGHGGILTVTVSGMFDEENRKDWLEEPMPIYEYECDKCSSRFELKRHFTENTEVNCPRCQGKVHQIFSPVPIIFKGPGFYVTDNMTGGGSLHSSSRDSDYTPNTVG